MALRLQRCVVLNSRSLLITQCLCVSVINVFRKTLALIYLIFPLLRSHRTSSCQLLLIIVLQDKLAAPVRINLLSVW